MGNWTGGSTSAWRKVRALVVARDGRCLLRSSPKCNGLPQTVHHTQDRAVVGDDPAFLIAACKPCNYGYGAPLDAKHGDPAPTPRTIW